MYYLLGILLVGAAYGAPNHVKYVEKGVAGGAAVGEGGASASWGPFSASAGIGGANGLAHAGATTGAGAGASAGVGSGSSSGAFASTGTAGGAGFFDSIFNIPISVLKSVNTHLNNKDTQEALAMRRAFKQCKRHGNCKALEVLQGSAGAGAGASAGASAGAQSDVLSRGAFSAEAGASANTGSGSSHIGTVGHKNYDSTFAIPIAALSSVNDFLNGKGK